MKDTLGSPKLHALETTALAFCLAIVLCAACLPLAYANLQADDLCRSVRLRQAGIIDCVQHDYQTFTGRWFGFGLEYTTLSLVQGSPGYGLALGAIALVYWSSIIFLLRALFPKIGFKRRYLIAGGFFALYWVGLASTKDSFYWLCGSVEYQLSLALGLIAIAATLLAAERAAAKKSFQLPWLLAMLAAILTPGLHELFGLTLCIVLITGTLLAWKWQSAGKNIWLVVTTLAIAGFLFAFLAPGNSMRSANVEHSREFWPAAKVALSTMAQALPDWVFNFRLIVATLLLIACVPNSLDSSSWLLDDRKRLLRWAIPVVWIVLLVGCFFGPAYGTGQVVASRTLAASYMIFLLGWFLNWLVIAAWLRTNSIQLISLHPIAKTMTIVLLAASLVMTGNTRRVLREMVGPIPTYSKAKARWSALLQKGAADEQQEVVLPRIADPPHTIGFSDITSDPENWINQCAAKYYGVQRVRVEKE